MESQRWPQSFWPKKLNGMDRTVIKWDGKSCCWNKGKISNSPLDVLSLRRFLIIQEENDTETATEYASLRSALEMWSFMFVEYGVFKATRRVSSPHSQAFYVQSTLCKIQKRNLIPLTDQFWIKTPHKQRQQQTEWRSSNSLFTPNLTLDKSLIR